MRKINSIKKMRNTKSNNTKKNYLESKMIYKNVSVQEDNKTKS